MTDHTATDIRAAITLLVSDNRMEHVKNSEKLLNLGVISQSDHGKLQYGLEARYNIDIDDQCALDWETVGDVVRDVQNMLNVSRPLIGELIPTDNWDEVGTIEHMNLDGTKTTVRLPPVPEAKPAINRIEREDVEDFKFSLTYAPQHDTFNEYQRIATKSAIYPSKGTPFGLMYAALGLAEAGEVQNKVKKAFRDDGVIQFHGAVSARGREVEFHPITPERRAAIIKELGGVLWYIAAVCDEINATMSEVALGNLEELCGRTERDTLRGDGDER